MPAYNPKKERWETIGIEFTEKNTTGFPHGKKPVEVSMTTDFEGDILIRTFDYTYPFRIYDKSRAGIGDNRKEADRLLRRHKEV